MSAPESIILTGLILLFASIIRGTSGFGLALFALPLLSIFHPVKEAVVLLAAVNFLFSIIYIIRERGRENIRIILLTGLFSMAGVFCGFLLLKSIPDRWIAVFAGSVIVISGLAMFRGFTIKISNRSAAYSIASFFGGILAGSITVGGPFVALVLTGTNISKDQFRSAMAYFFLFSYGFALILYSLNSMIDNRILLHTASSLPFLFFGLIIGEKVAKKVDQRSFRYLILSLLLIMGILMIYRNIS